MNVKMRLIGAPKVCYGNAWQNVALHKPYLLIFYLVYKNTWVSRAELLDLFYPDSTTEKARVNLRSLLKRLRKTPLASNLEVENDQLRFLAASDVKSFQEAISNRDWQTAIELYRGEFLKGFCDTSLDVETWLALERESFKEAYELAVLNYARALEKNKLFEEAAQLLAVTLSESPLNEEMVQTYMSCAYLAGKRQQALKVFRNFEIELKRELDVIPLIETLQLAQQIKENPSIASEDNLRYGSATTLLSTFFKIKQENSKNPLITL